MARNGLTNIRRLIDITKKNLTPDQSFVTDLKRSIEMTENREKRKPSKYYKPSNMNCLRAMYYTRIGQKPDEGGSSYMNWGICNSGTDIHERVQVAISHMSSNGFPCDYINVGEFVNQRELKHLKVVGNNGMETKLLHKALNLSFLCDGIIRYKDHYYILEIKTESGNKWYSREGVDPSHFRQAICYSTALEINDVLFLYINRDIFDFKAYLYTVTDNMKNDLVGYIEECDGYVKRLVAPPKPEDVSKKTCEYCNYKDSCRKELG